MPKPNKPTLKVFEKYQRFHNTACLSIKQSEACYLWRQVINYLTESEKGQIAKGWNQWAANRDPKEFNDISTKILQRLKKEVKKGG